MIVMVNMKNVILRGKTYYFRMGVPKECAAAVGKTEVTQSLKTADELEARKAADLLTKKWTAKFEAIRKPALQVVAAATATEELAGEFRQSLLSRVGKGMPEIIERESDADLEITSLMTVIISKRNERMNQRLTDAGAPGEPSDDESLASSLVLEHIEFGTP
jgi:hypothetical protein